MRNKRAKAYRKLMELYSMSFGFRQPYQVLVDSEMCKMSTEHKLDLSKQLESVLRGAVKPMITQCCIHELYLQGKLQQDTVDLAKTYERRKCNHKEAIAGDDCLASVIGESNKHRYVVATQSHPLRMKLRAVPAVPIVHVNRSVMVLEPPSDATIKIKTLTEEQALHPTVSDLASVSQRTTEEPRKKRKIPKAPNPLSVKKKKVIPVEATKKGKGKGKICVARPVSAGAEHERVGGKRKRTDVQESQTVAPATIGIDDNTKNIATGHRRKRRRRGVGAPTGSTDS